MKDKIEKIFDEIIKDEDNMEMNVGYFKESYINRIMELFKASESNLKSRLKEKIEKLKHKDFGKYTPTDRIIGYLDCLDDILKLLEEEI